jgi:Flp pilus assembly protein TadG
MLRSRHCHDRSAERGSAALEFVTTGMILLVPLVYLVLAMSSIQAGALSVEGASRQAARVYVQARTSTEATQQAKLAVEFALADYGLRPDQATVSITCSPEPTNCLTRGGYVTVSVRASVSLPLAPPTLTLSKQTGVTVSSSATQQVSRFWGAE